VKKLVIALGMCVASTAMAADLKAGLWEYTAKIEMPGMPFAMPPQTTQHCLTQADVDKGTVEPAGRQNGCEVKNLKQSGGKVSYDVACQGATPSNSHAEFTTTATTLEGVTTTDMGGQKMTTKMTGRRVGDCKG
jgi:hypothetical protein